MTYKTHAMYCYKVEKNWLSQISSEKIKSPSAKMAILYSYSTPLCYSAKKIYCFFCFNNIFFFFFCPCSIVGFDILYSRGRVKIYIYFIFLINLFKSYNVYVIVIVIIISDGIKIFIKKVQK